MVCPFRTWSPTLTRLMMRSTCARNSAMRSSWATCISAGPTDQPGQDIVAKCEVGAGCDGLDRHDDKDADHDPECNWPDPDLTSGGRERVPVVSAATSQRPIELAAMSGERAGLRLGSTKGTNATSTLCAALGPDGPWSSTFDINRI